MHVGDSSLELSTDALSFDGDCEQSSLSAGSVDKRNVEGASQYTSSHESFEVHKQSLHIREGHDDIPLCVGFGRKQCVGLDVVLFNDVGVTVGDGIWRNSDPRECVDANFLGFHNVGVCILNSLLLLEVHATWRFSLCQWSLRRVLHYKVSLWDHDRGHEQTKLALLANTRPRKGLRRYEFNRASRGDKEYQRDRILGDNFIRLLHQGLLFETMLPIFSAREN